ncbi:MAG: cysteine protease StiP domain-containing protein [Desulfococcaceae bacterium]
MMPSDHPDNLWNQTVYARIEKEVDPFRDKKYFRPLHRAYTGDTTFWSVPSPEPDLDDEFWEMLKNHLDSEIVKSAAVKLGEEIFQWEPDGNKLIFAAILRAGVPIADWLCQMMHGSVAVSLSLFVGLGIDRIALQMIQKTWPERKIVFVDGWTGKGGVARAIRELNCGPLAVLNDPWGCADFSGIQKDIFCPTACFTGASTLGFSRTFFTEEHRLFSAYRFPRKYCRTDLVEKWQKLCPKSADSLSSDMRQPEPERNQKSSVISVKPSVSSVGKKIFAKSDIADFNHKEHKEGTKDTGLADRNSKLIQNGSKTQTPFFMETKLRIHANEVCRALINAAPENVMFFHDAAYVKEHYPLLPVLAERRKVNILYECRELENLKTAVACSLKTEN